ncbi:MAG TPA: bifunctional UDP-N-acetylglucosamine diphosphorylase/glucosamine-1-phosphate N-acetyltransferase GlmU [Actinomycetota bacterium]|nr:bifunctional UDP-N-acetylglucosamine diphosphorylase/glucosamine-1-phosphate N-acetyltransferase GlmU [Actinomycetota bacterium]
MRRSPARKPRVGAIILAGGRSVRFRSATPKVLHTAAGRPLVVHVLETLREVHRRQKISRACLVVPPGGAVESALAGIGLPFDLEFAVQKQPRGTGDAARGGLGPLKDCDEVIVLAGDAPLVLAGSIGGLIAARRRRGAGAAVLTARLEDPRSYGRIVRRGGRIEAIVEERDATPEQRQISEVNASCYAFARDSLAAELPRLRASNVQRELLLTDVIGRLAAKGGVTSREGEPGEVLGANTRRDFELVTSILRRRVLDSLMDAGVTVVDPATTYVDAGVSVGPDSVLHPMTFLEGATRVGAACEIGPAARLVDCDVADGARIAFAVARSARIGPRVEVGPFASLRPGTVLHEGSKAGTFVEMKNADVGEGAKVPHLAYMGDVTIGRGSNVGAGTITCNYDPFKPGPDGSTKHRTEIGEDVYISSDTMLVAPVTLGDGSRTGAGSVVTHDVPPGELVYGVPARPRAPSEPREAADKSRKSGRRKRGS